MSVQQGKKRKEKKKIINKERKVDVLQTTSPASTSPTAFSPPRLATACTTFIVRLKNKTYKKEEELLVQNGLRIVDISLCNTLVTVSGSGTSSYPRTQHVLSVKNSVEESKENKPQKKENTTLKGKRKKNKTKQKRRFAPLGKIVDQAP